MFNKVGSQLQILNSQHPLYKVASAGNNIVTAKSDNFTYFQTIALHADVPNLNGDVFPLDELKKSYKSFIGRGLYLDHNAQSVANAVGKVFDAKLIEIPGATEEEGKYGVVCLCGVDKVTHPDIAAKVAHGVLDSVSMGASVGSCTCGICGVKCSTPEEFCVHLQHQGQIDPDTGKKCTSINHDVSFTELSIVGVAADPYAKMQQVFADFVGGMTKVAGEPKQFLEKFSFSIPCGNEKLCEMIYNLLDGYKKQGIMDLSADGSILKLSVEAKSEAEALKKLESISQEQGLDVEKPLQKEEKSMSEEIKPVEEQVEKKAGIVPTEDVTLDNGTTYTVRYNPTEQSILSVMQDGKEVGIDGGTRLQILRKLFHKDEPTIVEEKTAELEPTVSQETIQKCKELDEQSNIEKNEVKQPLNHTARLMHIHKIKAGYSNNPDYYGDWFGDGQIDFSKVIDAEAPGDIYMVKIWGGSGYVLDVYLVKANDYEEAIDKVFEWSYNNEGKNNIIFDWEYLAKDCHEDYETDGFLGDGKPSDTMDYEEFEERWMEDMVSNSAYSLFARAENFFVDKVPTEYLPKEQNKSDLQEVESSNTQSNEVKDVKAEEKKEEVKQEKTAAMVPPFANAKAPAAPVADPIAAPAKAPEVKPEIPAPAPEVKPLKDAPLADAPMGDKPLGDKPMADKPAVPPMADGKEKFEEVKPEAPADKIKTTQDAAKALLDALKAGENADLKALEDVINFLKADKKEAPAKEEKKEDKKDEKKEDKKEDAPKAEEKKDAPKEDKKDDKEPAKEEKKDDKLAEEKKAEAESTTEEIPVEAKKEEKEEVKPTFANVTRVSLLKTANILDSKWVFHLKGTNKVACLSIKNLLPGVSEKVAYLTSKEFYNEMMSTLEKHAALNEGAVKEITANFNEKVKVDSDEKKSQIAKATNKVKVETDAKKVSDTASKVTESLTDDGKAQKQDKVNSKEDAGAIESASKKAPVETDIKVDAAMESKLKQVTAALEAKEAELNQLKLHQALEAKTAKARNIVSMSIKAGLVKCNEQFRQEELLKQASPVKAKEEAMRRTADAMVKDLLGMSDDELDRQASYLSNFKVEAEVKQLKPIKIEASYNESNEASIIEALAAQMM